MSVQVTTPKEHFGFLIFRTEYKSEAQWERFMAFLKYQARRSLTINGFPEFYEHIDWKIIDAPDESEYQVRERFNQWLDSSEETENPENYRYHACVMVCQEYQDYVDEFMEGKSMEDDDDVVDEFDETLVTVVSRYQEEGEVDVSIRHLIPRAGDMIAEQGEGSGWKLLWVRPGELATARTEIQKILGTYRS